MAGFEREISQTLLPNKKVVFVSKFQWNEET